MLGNIRLDAAIQAAAGQKLTLKSGLSVDFSLKDLLRVAPAIFHSKMPEGQE
jgi:hypothetical protein